MEMPTTKWCEECMGYMVVLNNGHCENCSGSNWREDDPDRLTWDERDPFDHEDYYDGGNILYNGWNEDGSPHRI